MKYIRFIFKASISLIVLSFIIKSIGPKKIFNIVSKSNLILYSVAFALYLLGDIISAKKLQILIHAKADKLPLKTFIQYHYIGQFFNTFLPTNIGGDAFKAKGLSRYVSKNSDSYSAVFMERFTGLVALVMVAATCSIFFLKAIPLRALIILYGIVIPGIIGIGLLFWHGSFSDFVLRLTMRIEEFQIIREFGISSKLQNIFYSVQSYKGHHKAVWKSMGLSTLFYLSLILNHILLGLSVGIDLNPVYFFVFIPLVSVIIFLPISLGGFGVREASYLGLFLQVGVAGEKIIAMSLLFETMVILGAAIGAAIHIKKPVL